MASDRQADGILLGVIVTFAVYHIYRENQLYYAVVGVGFFIFKNDSFFKGAQYKSAPGSNYTCFVEEKSVKTNQKTAKIICRVFFPFRFFRKMN